MSNETKWTSWPWVVTNESGRVEIDGANGDGIIGINSQSLSWLEIDDANANLIAAAPELYEALDACIKWFNSGDYNLDFIKNAKSSMAKARGEQ